MAKLSVSNLRLAYGDNEILKGLSLETREGDVVALLGQSGCGKTTLLRSIAGLETPSAGKIQVGDKVIFDADHKIALAPEKRGLGLVFQSYALWPHRTVFENVAYGIRLKKVLAEEVKSRVRAAMEGIGIAHLGDRHPHQLSGGQQQRVALARAMVYDPPIILLDEPLSNLDAKLREEARIWIRSLIKQTGRTAVFVTHDQEEAMAVADQVVLLDQGRMIQSGTPEELYGNPNSLFAATFMGSNNQFEGKLIEVRGDRTMVQVGDSRIWALNKSDKTVGETTTVVSRVEVAETSETPGENSLSATLLTKSYLGSRWEYIYDCSGHQVRVTSRKPLPHQSCFITWPADGAWAF
ncbi:ABC transporter ATP-binding protein [Paracoccus sp. DMF-8]|uniref:ABC transporter ATP-binding protein n=1 Tax=Paracoccus sp. DMF-8 TaxID=3019445 RepID=UPI0023E80094|nr:ABC transporter ATP-binding protein [Paracoccus sp. DMF-8]MDF3606689.1 ABC transporter ATP-binding protein [Paracoccus sp. DMF-8]